MDIINEQSAQIMKSQFIIPEQQDMDVQKVVEVQTDTKDNIQLITEATSDPEPFYEEEIKTSAFHIVPDGRKRGRGRPPKKNMTDSIKNFVPRILKREKKTNYFDDPEVIRVGRKRGRPVKLSNESDKLYECSRCEFKTTRGDTLELHFKTHDGNAYPCPFCSFSCSQKGNLTTHIRTHTKDKPFKCMFCDFAATQKVNLQVHIRTHTKEKPFKCQFCDFAAAQKCNLITHVTRRHSNVQTIDPNESYSCTNLWSSDSENHKSYKCGNCSFRCKLKNEMFLHVKTNHPLADLVTCDFKSLLF